MDVADAVISAVVGLAFFAFGIPLAFGFLNAGNFTLVIGGTTYALGGLIALAAIVVILGIVVLLYRHHKA